MVEARPEDRGSYAAFATGLLGYLLLNFALWWSVWETAGPTTGQQVVMWSGLLVPPTALGVLVALPASRRAGGPWLRGLAVGCLGGAVLVLALAVLGRFAQ